MPGGCCPCLPLPEEALINTHQDLAHQDLAHQELAHQDMVQRFMYWQCRIRQTSVRMHEGRPTAGMRPLVTLSDSSESLGTVNVLILKNDPHEHTANFKFIVRKTQDPTERIKNGLHHLSEAYYQQPLGFSPQITALFALDSEVADKLFDAGKCRLDFEQESQKFELNCAVRDLPEDDKHHQAIFWHNSMFNPGMPGHVRVLGFTPQDP
jgi:hypothetical protein